QAHGSVSREAASGSILRKARGRPCERPAPVSFRQAGTYLVLGVVPVFVVGLPLPQPTALMLRLKMLRHRTSATRIRFIVVTPRVMWPQDRIGREQGGSRVIQGWPEPQPPQHRASSGSSSRLVC